MQDIYPYLIGVLPGILGSVALAGVVALVSLRLRLLTRSGALAAFVVGAVVFWAGDGRGALPLIAFFATANAWGRWRRPRKEALLLEKDGPRDAIQVLANGGLAALMLLLSVLASGHAALLYLLFAAAIASACADTWATEIGAASRETPRLITTLAPVAAGRSGGVSVSGLLAGACGAGLIGLCSMPLFAPAARAGDFVIIALCGLAGSIVDSFLGATLQSHPVFEMRAFGNDLVNFLAIAAACLLALALRLIFW